MLTLYDYLPSQNAYKVRLLLNHLGTPYDTVIVSIFEGEGRKPEFLAVNPMGTVPAIRLEDGRVLAESNAILIFLAHGTRYLPNELFAQAKVHQWLSFERSYVGPTIATLRYWRLTGKLDRQTDVAGRHALGLRVLGVLDEELGERPFIAGNAYTIVDMSLFAYVHRADEADFPLGEYPNVVRWIRQVQSQDGFLDETYPYSIDPHSAEDLP